MSGTCAYSYFFRLALVIACGPPAIACGGQAVDGAPGVETAESGSELAVSSAGGVSSSGGESSSGTEGGRADSEFREAALERAARFVNDYEVSCQHERVTFPGSDYASAYPTRVLQTRGRPSPYAECGEIDDADEQLACWQGLACDFDWWNELDWSQWSPGATVIEVAGVWPEQINVARTTFESAPLPDGSMVGYVSFYENPPPEPVPPGSHDCGYFWYLDATPEGVALVLGSGMAAEVEGALASTELNLCLTE